MNTTDFYNLAIIAAKERGYEKPNVTTISGNYNGKINHICKLWDGIKRKHIDSGLHDNPVAAIIAFKDAIDFENKTYSKIVEDVDL